MDHFQGITAKIISNGQIQTLYDDPDSTDTEEGYARHHYVESFYRMNPEHAVRISVKIGGNSGSSSCRTYTKESLQKAFSRGETGDYTFTGPVHFCQQTGQWMWSDYSFGNLVLKDTPDSELSVEQAQELGKIQIIIRRVIMEKRKVAYIQKRKPIATINEVPEKALKGRPIETTVRLTNARPIPKKSPKTESPKNISGEAGKPLVFNIYYRSRRALQMLGCIPRSPSPAIEISDDEANKPVVKSVSDSLMTGNARSLDELLRQIQILNARITDLERAKVNAEPANTDTVIKDEGVSVKREREEDGGNEGSRPKRRAVVKIEHVDLTDE